MGERYFPYIVRDVIYPIDEMRHLPKIVRYIKKTGVRGSWNPWRWTHKRKDAHVFARKYEALKVADALGGELVRADNHG